jgi:putative phage-type endonuclease
MKKIDLNQAGPDWHRWRREGLGGSDVSALVDGTYTSPDELLEIKLGLRTVAENDAMRRGKRLEPEARAKYIEVSGNEVVPMCAEHEEYPFMRASLDGLSSDGKLVLEIKCPGYWPHRRALKGYVPSYYVAQVQHQLFVTGAERADYFSYRPDDEELRESDRWALIEVFPDPDYQRRLLKAAQRFWDKLQRLREGSVLQPVLLPESDEQS